MNVPCREMFIACLKERFAPALRREGFKGSGQHFLRTSGEAINAVNIQGSKNGDGCFVNLGLHYAFLPPCWSQNPEPVEKWKEIDCEFRWRLDPPTGEKDLWGYGRSAAEARTQVELIVAEFKDKVEPVFERFATPDALASEIPFESLAAEQLSHLRWMTTTVRYALALARIHAHLGNTTELVRFAKLGLQRLGRASLLSAPLNELAGAT